MGNTYLVLNLSAVTLCNMGGDDVTGILQWRAKY